MYVGYAVLDGKCYRFSTPEALYKFTSVYMSAREVTDFEARKFDVIHDYHEFMK